MLYSVSPFFFLKSCGPKPKENCSTRTPTRLAPKKWPNSCAMIRTLKTKIKIINENVADLDCQMLQDKKIAFYVNEKTEKSFRNIPQLEIVFLKNINPFDVLNYKYLLIENPAEAVKFLEARG